MRWLSLCLVLGGCAAAPEMPRLATGGSGAPRAVTLYRDTVTVVMADGTLCTGARTASSGPWDAVLAGCPHPWRATVARPAAVPRVPLAPAGTAPAWVTLAPPGAPILGYAPRAAAGG